MDGGNSSVFKKFAYIRTCLMFGILAAIATAPCQAMDGLPDQPGQYELELLHDNQKRSYILHIPPTIQRQGQTTSGSGLSRRRR